MANHFTIGIDTGGTYTDAVIVDKNQQKILASAKSLTTHDQLAVGVSDALSQVLQTATSRNSTFRPDDISMVSLSTTLATNALVEGQGSSLGVFLLGFNDAMVERTQIAQAIPEAKVMNIAGGHVYTGQEQQTLDVDAIRTALEGEMGKLEAFAVAGHYSVRNQSHERAVEYLVKEITGAPITASCDLSDSLNGPRRALTAAFNARIVSLIVKLEVAVHESMNTLGLKAPIMIVKGDGSIASAESVIAKPIETILSGPAASVIGARFLTGESDFLISDIGGTTTDVASVINGWPGLNNDGADVGGYRTLVKAIDMKTLGLGGDSEVEIGDLQKLRLLPNRVLPLSMLAARWPHIEKELANALNAVSGMRFATQYLVLQSAYQPDDLTTQEQEFLSRLDPDKPSHYRETVDSAKDRSCLKRLINRGFVRKSGFTPSDAAHVLGLQSQWNTQAARHACELLVRSTRGIEGASEINSQLQAFSQEVHDAVVEKSTRLLIDQLGGQSFKSDDKLITASATGIGKIHDLNVKLQSKLPIVAVGGPAGIFYPKVAERLGQAVILPQYNAVANAIGAAVGLVKSSCTIELNLHEKGHFIIHSADLPINIENATEALELATALAKEGLAEDLKSKGGKSESLEGIKIHIDRIDLPGAKGDWGLMSARVTAEFIGDSS
jgi:N-methylhydantoinase A/oxoprolinase/acetone carboxylase beta subunit